MGTRTIGEFRYTGDVCSAAAAFFSASIFFRYLSCGVTGIAYNCRCSNGVSKCSIKIVYENGV